MTGATSGGTHVEKTTSFGAARAAGLARAASRKLAVLSEATRNAVLEAAAKRLEENAARIVSANANDVRDAEERGEVARQQTEDGVEEARRQQPFPSNAPLA